MLKFKVIYNVPFNIFTFCWGACTYWTNGGEHRVVMPRFEVTSIYTEWRCPMLYHQMGHEANPTTTDQATWWQRVAWQWHN